MRLAFALLLSALAALACLVCAGRDYYDLLGVPRDAHVSVIKKSYRRLARIYHPDKHPGDEKMEAKFKDISKAYEVLSDKQKRQQYDNFGEEGLENGGDGASGFGGFHGGHGFKMNFDASMFEDMFGGGFGGFDTGGFGSGFSGGFDDGRRRYQRQHRQHQPRKICFQNKLCENGSCFMVKECKS